MGLSRLVLLLVGACAAAAPPLVASGTQTFGECQLALPEGWETGVEQDPRIGRIWKLHRDLHDPVVADAVLYKAVNLGPSLDTAARMFGEETALPHVLEESLHVVEEDALAHGDHVVSKQVMADGFRIETNSTSETMLQRVLVIGKSARSLTCTWGTMDPARAKPTDDARLRSICSGILDSFRKSS